MLIGRVAAIFLLRHVRIGALLAASLLAAIGGCGMLMLTNNRFGAGVGLLFVGGGFANVLPAIAQKMGSRLDSQSPARFERILLGGLTCGMLICWLLGYGVKHLGVRVVLVVPLVGACIAFILAALIWLEARFRR